jgi:hypothetical protein
VDTELGSGGITSAVVLDDFRLLSLPHRGFFFGTVEIAIECFDLNSTGQPEPQLATRSSAWRLADDTLGG